MADNQGGVPTDVNLGFEDITEELCLDLVPVYLPALPTDPTDDFDGAAIAEADCDDLDGQDSGYEVEQDADDRITVRAPGAQLGETIEVTR